MKGIESLIGNNGAGGETGAIQKALALMTHESREGYDSAGRLLRVLSDSAWSRELLETFSGGDLEDLPARLADTGHTILHSISPRAIRSATYVVWKQDDEGQRELSETFEAIANTHHGLFCETAMGAIAQWHVAGLRNHYLRAYRGLFQWNDRRYSKSVHAERLLECQADDVAAPDSNREELEVRELLEHVLCKLASSNHVHSSLQSKILTHEIAMQSSVDLTIASFLRENSISQSAYYLHRKSLLEFIQRELSIIRTAEAKP